MKLFSRGTAAHWTQSISQSIESSTTHWTSPCPVSLCYGHTKWPKPSKFRLSGQRNHPRAEKQLRHSTCKPEHGDYVLGPRQLKQIFLVSPSAAFLVCTTSSKTRNTPAAFRQLTPMVKEATRGIFLGQRAQGMAISRTDGHTTFVSKV